MAADETTDDPIDGWRKANRLSIRCVLVTGDADPGPALAAAGIFDPVAIPVVLGDRPDLPGGILSDGRTPNLTGTLEFDQLGAFGSPPGAQRQPAQSAADGWAPSGPVTTTVPPAFGMKSLAPIRVRAPIPSRISHSRQTPNPTSPAQPADAPDGAAPKDPVNDVVHDRLTSDRGTASRTHGFERFLEQFQRQKEPSTILCTAGELSPTILRIPQRSISTLRPAPIKLQSILGKMLVASWV